MNLLFNGYIVLIWDDKNKVLEMDGGGGGWKSV